MIKTLLDAIQNECVPQFMEHQNGRPELASTRIDMSARSDGRRTTIEGLKTYEVQNGKMVELWKGIEFVDCQIHSDVEVTFEDCNFVRSHWYQDRGRSDRLINCQFSQESRLSFSVAMTENCGFSDTVFGLRAESHWTDVRSVIERCRFEESTLVESTFSESQFFESDIRVQKWLRSSFTRVRFRNCSLQFDARFVQCEWDVVEIDREFVDSLGPNRGGISDHELRRYFKVVDSITDLRLAFGGWRRLLHIATILLFAAPYIGHMGRKLIESWTNAATETESLAWSLARYGLFGNQDYFTTGTVISLVTAIVFLAYNLARAALLVKSRNLEHEHEIQGIWPQFSIDESLFGSQSNRPPRWRHLLSFVNYVAYLALASAAWHFLKLLSTRVPA